jgi:D-cysteine desulfhydrase
MELSAYPRAHLGIWPTPLVRARRLEAKVGGGPLLFKRDDLSGFAFAGNKTRQLEYLVGGAVSEGYRALVVGGVATSNFCAGAAVAARLAGLECHIVLPGEPPAPSSSANLAMALECGAQLTFSGGPRELLDERIRERADELTASGRRAMAIPRGGASPVGALGFFRAAAELSDQLVDAGHDRARLVIAVGSGGSIAGLYAASASQRTHFAITGVSVSRSLAKLTPHLVKLAEGCADLLGVRAPDPAALELIDATGSHDGADGVDATEHAASLLALETEGVVLDPHYTAQAFPIALRMVEKGRAEGVPVVFWHTGGAAAAISAYALAGNTSNGAGADVVCGAS